MSKYTKIYLDLDGVIADFSKRYKEMFHITPQEADRNRNFGSYFNTFIENKQFASLDMMTDARMLLDHLNTLDVPVEILSSTARQESHVDISDQKRVWLISHGINYTRNFVPGKNLKYTFATPESIIIDDTLSVISDWVEAGGTAIHHTDAASTIASLDALLRV
jgi:hypothetical protein